LNRLPWLLAFALVGSAVSGACSTDPVHDNEVSALGPEQAGVAPGADHRPGQPCLVCHGGSGPASTQFSAGGTVYQDNVQAAGAGGVTVTLTDSANHTGKATTTSSGNFFILQSAYAPQFPVGVQITFTADGAETTVNMGTHIGRDASCATCHFDPPGVTTPGHIYL
jgi:hypothetical protein